MVDKIIYINLASRPDRSAQLETHLTELGLDNYERFEAVRNPSPLSPVGCLASHLGALQRAQAEGYGTVLILEDDFESLVEGPELGRHLSLLEKIDFDVCFLSAGFTRCIPTDIPELVRVADAQQGVAYIVRAHYYETLINLFAHAVPLFEATGAHWLYANDQVWKPLQLQDMWLSFLPCLGKQRPGYSDNAQATVEYPYGLLGRQP